MEQLTCPKPDQIAQYVLGTLAEAEAQQVAGHLAECPACQAVADQCDAARDPLIDMLRTPKPESPYEAEPQCQRALNRMTNIRRKFPWILQPAEGEGQSGEGESPSGGELDLPQVMGEYLLFEYIGGNLGDVYKALHLELERLVALKMLPNSLVADEAAAQRFAREIRATGRLDHPNLVRAHDAREIGGRRFLVMEYVDGRDLDELVRRRGPLPIADACQVARQAAVALQYVCQHGMVHRDVKPANLMLSRDGQVKLLDLGLARFRISQQPSGGLLQASGDESTGPGVAMGTADYMAPEQISDSHHVDIRADIYSLGCTLYKLLTGHTPFEGPEYETLLDKLNGHLRRSPVSIRQLRGEVPDGLAAVVSRMMAKNPAERFDTPDQVATALQPFTEGASLQALVAGRNGSDLCDEPVREAVTPRPRWLWEVVGLVAAATVIAVIAWGGNGFDFALSHPPDSPEPVPGVQAADPAQSEIENQQPKIPPITSDAKSPNSVQPPSPKPDAAESTPAPSPIGFAVRVDLDHADGIYRGPPAGPDGQGELIHMAVTSEQPGYLYLLSEQADGTLVCLFPNSHQADNRVDAGGSVTVPASEDDFELRAGPPYGTEVVTALVSRKPLAPSRFGVASLTEQQFTQVDGDAVKRLRAEMKQDGGSEVEVKLTTQPVDPPSSGSGEIVPEHQEMPAPTIPPAPAIDPGAGAPPIVPPAMPQIEIQVPDSEPEDTKSNIRNPRSTGPVLVADTEYTPRWPSAGSVGDQHRPAETARTPCRGKAVFRH